MLDRNGGLREGIAGTFDARGYSLRLGPDGAPRFVASDEGDERWDSQFSSLGPDESDLYAVAVRGSDVYVGGSFTVVGKAAVNNLARWDGSRWHPVGVGEENGTDGPVYSIAFHGASVIVGGSFTRAGSVEASNIAIWNGTAWSPLGKGLDDAGLRTIVYALAVRGDHVYAGGIIGLAGGVPVRNLARYDLKFGVWSEVGGGVSMGNPDDPALVAVLAFREDQLYVGGKFTVAGGISASHIARFDTTTGRWHRLGVGMDDWVLSIAFDGDDVYAGGFFKTAGHVPVHNVARWDGRVWRALGRGLDMASSDVTVRVKGLAFIGGYLYAAGDLERAGGETVQAFARWNGREWESLPGLTSGFEIRYSASVLAMGSNPGGLYVAGGFNRSGEPKAFHVSHFDIAAMRWRPMVDAGSHQGLHEGSIFTVAVGNGSVYVGGSTMYIGDIYARGIARWDGERWHALDDGIAQGVNGLVYAIAVRGDDVYVAGFFSYAGSGPAINIARFDGGRWYPLGSGIGGRSTDFVAELALDPDGNLYAGGSFERAGEVQANSIARWNGSAWSALGTPEANGVDGSVLSIAADRSQLYVGGYFSHAGGAPANNIARWDGAQWQPLLDNLHDGVEGPVFSVLLDGRNLYVGGYFRQAGGVEVNNVARWDGSSWSNLGKGTAVDPGSWDIPVVTSLAYNAGRLYATGGFTSADGHPASHVAVWDGSRWSPLGSGLNRGPDKMAVGFDSLWLAGWITRAGNKPSVGVARWLF